MQKHLGYYEKLSSITRSSIYYNNIIIAITYE